MPADIKAIYPVGKGKLLSTGYGNLPYICRTSSNHRAYDTAKPKAKCLDFPLNDRSSTIIRSIQATPLLRLCTEAANHQGRMDFPPSTRPCVEFSTA